MVKPEKLDHLHLVYHFTLEVPWKTICFLQKFVKLNWQRKTLHKTVYHDYLTCLKDKKNDFQNLCNECKKSVKWKKRKMNENDME